MSDNTIEVECLGDFFRNLGMKGLNVSNKLAKNVLSNSTRDLDITVNIATAASGRYFKKIVIIT